LYAHILDELRSRDFHRLKGYVSDPGSKFTTWLTVVARRACVDRHRARFGRRRTGEDGDQLSERVMRARLEQLVSAPVDPASLPADAASSPDAALRASQIGDVLQHALGALPAADRLLLKLRFEDELPAREIALVLQLPSPFHVYRRINALLGELRMMLTANGVESAAP
jgi:RNA polymerase sigma factor (sigma-70 family)